MKWIIQSLLRPFGYQIHDMRKFGRDPWRDLQILLQSVPAPLCFDVGAHRGETLGHIVENFPKATIYAFEPDPDNFAALQKAAAQFPQAKLYSLAMGDSQTKAMLQKTAFSMSNSILSPETDLKLETHRKIGEVEISVTTLDQFCKEQGIGNIDLLKTDCQGFDLRVLRGASRMLAERRVNIIQCESLFAPEYQGQGWFYEVLHFLNDSGYAPVSFGEPARNKHHEALWCDVIFKRREPTE